jgi:hypothetical protein
MCRSIYDMLDSRGRKYDKKNGNVVANPRLCAQNNKSNLKPIAKSRYQAWVCAAIASLCHKYPAFRHMRQQFYT